MSAFVYLLAEGVTDVTLISLVLRRHQGFKSIRKADDLTEPARQWIAGFKWPHRSDIKRLSVPAPLFLRRGDDLVALRNAEGLENLLRILRSDNERFLRIAWKPDALGIFLDADNRQPRDRLMEIQQAIAAEFEFFPGVHHLQKNGQVALTEDGRRAGILVLPGGNQRGTLEDLLLPLGERVFPELNRAGEKFVAPWLRGEFEGLSLKEIRKPAGAGKARLSAMAAILKPGKSLNASLQDDGWVPKDQPLPDILKPLGNFLGDLVLPDASA